jgi:hypothetical protein
MHRNHLQTILLAAAADPIVRKHGMTEADLLKCLVELRPSMNRRTLESAAALAMVPSAVLPV